MEKTTLYLPEDLQIALREAARRAGVPQAEVVREALTRYLGALPRPAPRSIGSWTGASIDATKTKELVRREIDRDYDRYLRDVGATRPKGSRTRGGKRGSAR